MKHVIPTLVGALTLYTMSPSGLAAPAHDDAVRQEIVRFGDLDLTRPADAQELYRRIKHAAHHVCEAIGFGDPTIAMSDRICIDQATARAVADINSPLLTERYAGQTRRQILPVQQARLNR
jgi:UrcA family protein